jgi:hypothetical protein
MRGTRSVAAWSGALLAASALSLAASATPVQVHLTARTTAAQEIPQQTLRNAKANGLFWATLKPTTNGYSLDWRLTFTRLTGPATSAIIHLGTRGAHGAAMAVLCSPCRSGATGSAYFSPPELVLARAGKLYVNVRTARNPDGEIRGQIAVG